MNALLIAAGAPGAGPGNSPVWVIVLIFVVVVVGGIVMLFARRR